MEVRNIIQLLSDQQNLFRAPFEALILLGTVTLLSVGVCNDNMQLFCFGVKKWFEKFEL